MIPLQIKDTEYKLTLNLKSIWELEMREQRSIMKMFQMDDAISVIDPLIKIFHASLTTHQPDITLNDCFDLFSDLVEHHQFNLGKFEKLIEELLEKSGLSLGEE